MTEFYASNEEIEALVTAFRNKTLDKSKWTHAAHLTTGLWYLKNHELHEATCLVKSGIIAYNLAVGGENTGSSGYHETMTLFWMDILHLFVSVNKNLSLKDTCNQFLSGKLAEKSLPFEFYTKEKLVSSPARARYMPPDIKEVNSHTVTGLVQLTITTAKQEA